MAMESTLGKSIIITLQGLMVKDLKDCGKITTEMVKESIFTLMAKKKKDYGKITSCKNEFKFIY